MKQYTDSDKENTGIDTSAAVQVMQEKLEILRAMFHGFDYSDFMGNSQKDRMRAITGGMNFVLGLPEKEQKNLNNLL